MDILTTLPVCHTSEHAAEPNTRRCRKGIATSRVDILQVYFESFQPSSYNKHNRAFEKKTQSAILI